MPAPSSSTARPSARASSFAAQAEGAEVTTVEGLSPEDGSLNPVQQAFADHHGLQCGFCTPGFVVSVTAFLDDNPVPTDEEIRHALSGNLCRCTGYQGIVDAVKAVAGTMSTLARLLASGGQPDQPQGGPAAPDRPRAVRRRRVRPGHAACRLRRAATSPAGGIVAIDTAAAATAPGRGRGADRGRHQPSTRRPDGSHARASDAGSDPGPYKVLADGEVRYVGDPYAMVVAASRALAEDAAELIELDVEPLPPVADYDRPALGER